MMNFIPVSQPGDGQPILAPEGLWNSVPASTLDSSALLNNIPLQVSQQSNQPIQTNNNQTMFDLVMGMQQGKDYGPKDEFSPIQTGNKFVDYVGNLMPNAVHDVGEIIQGGATMLAHPMQTVVNPVYNWATEKAPNQSIGENIGDIVNTLIAKPAGMDVKKTTEFYKLLGQGKVKEAAELGSQLRGDFLEHFRKDPLITASILAPGATAKGIGTGTRAVGQLAEDITKGALPWGKAGRTAESIKDLAVKDVVPEMVKVSKAAKEMVKEAKKVDGNLTNNLAEVIRRRENNLEIPENLKATNEAYNKFYDEYIKTLPAEGLESTQSLVMNQYRANKTGKTYNEAAREFAPLEEMLYEGIDDGTLAANEARLKGLRESDLLKNKRNINKEITELTEAETEELLKYISAEELDALAQSGMKLKDARNYLGELVGEGRLKKGTKLTEEQQIRYKENLDKISELAAAGDEIAVDFLEAHAGYKNGTLAPTIKAGIKDVNLAGTLSSEALADRRFLGKGSSREYGTATPEQIAEAYAKNIDEVIDNIAQAKLDRLVSERILEGTLDGKTPLVTDSTTKVKYLDSALLEEGRIGSALKNAKVEPFEGSIPVDVNLIGALDNQFGGTSSNLFKGFLGDLYGLQKDAILSSGIYLGGNALSGAANALINSNIHLFNDASSAIASKGRLAEKLGTARRLGVDTRKFTNPVAQGIHNVNRATLGRVITDADAAMQNFFSEMAAHAKLRKQGIRAGERETALNNIAGMELADFIKDVKSTALINPSRSLVPKFLQPIAGISPFWRWNDTAIQAAYHTLVQHPTLSQAVAANFFGTIGMDREAQIRQGLKVETNKPFVTYRVDDKTGLKKEISMDFLPIMTAVKTVVEPETLMRSVPVLGLLTNVAQGKDAYGRPMQRTHSSMQDQTVVQGNIRYKRNEKTGMIEPLGGQLDETLAGLAKTFTGIPNIVNKTILPAAAGLANLASGRDDVKYYQPYGQSLFGAFSTGQPDNLAATLYAGDPTKGWTGTDLVKRLLSQYEVPYNPTNQARINRAFYKGASSRDRYEQAKLQGRR